MAAIVLAKAALFNLEDITETGTFANIIEL